jgi:biopolymer transport protein ExbD
MAGISVGGAHSGRRSVDHELPLVPFIDFMICLIAFLLVTAVWSQMSRIEATGRAPGQGSTPALPQKELHVVVSNHAFDLRWQQGATVIATERVPKTEVKAGDAIRFPALANAVGTQWRAMGAHRAASDPVRDRAVLHVPNDVAFEEIVAVMDALRAPLRARGANAESAFDVAFAEN